MNDDRLGHAVDRFVEDLTLGIEPDEREATQELELGEREDFVDCARAARWLEHAVVQASSDRMSKSDLPRLHPGVMLRTADVGKELGDFEIIREVGRGGMGIVFEARQKSLDRSVALKVLPPGVSWSEAATARFAREAKAAGRLRHPHIVPVYAFGEDHGVSYFAMQYIEGLTLSELAKLHKPAPAPKPVGASGAAGAEEAPKRSWPAQLPRPDQPEYYRTVAAAVARVAGAVQYAHEHGVVHRDIKPSNVMLDERGTVWITDFGLARMLSDPSVTRSGQLLGTLCYMSPEQAAGQGGTGERTDIYGLGATLYELISLRPPFAALKPQALLRSIREREPERPSLLNPHAPPELERIALRAMAKDPRDRFATAGEMAAELDAYLQGGSGTPGDVTRGRFGFGGRRVRGWVIPAGLAAAAVAIAAVIVSLSVRSHPRATPAASAVTAGLAADPVGELVALGRRDYENDDREAARSTFQAAVDHQSNAVLPHVYLGLLALREETDEATRLALTEFQLALELAPDSQVLRDLCSLAGAEERADWRRLRERFARIVDPCAEGFAADGYYAIGRAVEFRDPVLAVRLMGLALQCRPDFAGARAYRGRLLYRMKQHEAALSDLTAACESEPRRAIYHIWRAWALDALGRTEQARAAFDQAVEIEDSIATRKERFLWMVSRQPDLQPAFTPFGQTAVLSTELQAEYREIIKLKPQSFVDYFALGQLHAAAGRPHRALEAFRAAVDNLPEGKSGYSAAAAYLELGRVLRDHYGRYQSAEEDFRKAVAACPSLEFYLVLCDHYERLRKWNDVIATLDEAIRAGLPNEPRTRMARARAYDGLGRRDLAIRELEEALSGIEEGRYGSAEREAVEQELAKLKVVTAGESAAG